MKFDMYTIGLIITTLLIAIGLISFVRAIRMLRIRKELFSKYPNGFICNGIYYKSDHSSKLEQDNNTPNIPEELLPKNFKKIVYLDLSGGDPGN